MSCQDSLEDFEPACNENLSPNYSISVDEALANLDDFMQGDQAGTRSGYKRSVESVYPLRRSVVSTRSAVGNDEGNLLYVANFENEQGYAILAADARIGEKVIAITENGTLSQEAAYTAMQMTYEERPVFYGYPLDGPGLFTTEETGDEIFMNPNTVDLYDAESDEYMIGNLNTSDDTEDSEEGGMTRSALTTVKTGPQVMMCGLCLKYAGDAVENYKEDPDNPLVPIDGNVPQVPTIPSRGKKTYTTTTPWKEKVVGPFLSNLSRWNQGIPFNNLYPERRKFLVGKKKRASAGCFPLAIAKVMTYFKSPSSYTFNGYKIDWDALNSYINSTTKEQSAAHLLYSIAEGCNSWYFYEGTFTRPKKAKNFLKSMGYANAQIVDYDWEKVVEMINNECPLIIYGMPNIQFWNSHAWNIDGYKVKERTATSETYNNGYLVSRYTQKEICNMVHCCFGWKGQCDGFYVSGVFDTDDSNVEFDGYTTDGRKHFNNILNLLVYSKPLAD